MFGGQGTAARSTNQRGVLQTAAHLSPTLKWDSRLCHIFLLIIVLSTNSPFVFLVHGVLVSDLKALTLLVSVVLSLRSSFTTSRAAPRHTLILISEEAGRCSSLSSSFDVYIVGVVVDPPPETSSSTSNPRLGLSTI